MKATGSSPDIPVLRMGSTVLIDSCELTAGIPMLGSLKLLQGTGNCAGLPAETAYLSKLPSHGASSQA